MGECHGRYLHTVVFDPFSSSLWVYGGRDLSGRVCQEVAAVNLTSFDVKMTKARDGELRPEGRYWHTAIMMEVRKIPLQFCLVAKCVVHFIRYLYPCTCILNSILVPWSNLSGGIDTLLCMCKLSGVS